MNRLAEKDLQLLPQTRHISIRSTSFSTEMLPEAVRVFVPRIRTDLNRFTWREAVALIVHGIEVAELVSERDMGRIDDADRAKIYAALRKALGLWWFTRFEVSHANLEKSHQRRFRKLWLVGVAYLLATLYALHILGDLPLRGVGIAYNSWFRCPAFHQEIDRRRNAEFTTNEILKQAFAEHTSDQGNLIYESNSFAGPEAPSNMFLTFKRDGLTERELTVDSDFFAILIPEYGGLPDRVWLPCKVLDDSELRISVPPFRGFGRILLSADSPHPIILVPKAYQEVP